MQRRLVQCTALILLVSGAFLPGCRGQTKPSRLDVSLSEWRIEIPSEDVRPGPVKLTATNEGNRQHELLIVKTDLPPQLFPAIDGRVDESKLNIVARIQPVGPGASAETVVSLSPGKYALLCNLFETSPARVSHFDQGMVTPFNVLDRR